MSSRHPMFIWWGPELIQFYNDAYRETMGPERHPSALGSRASRRIFTRFEAMVRGAKSCLTLSGSFL